MKFIKYLLFFSFILIAVCISPKKGDDSMGNNIVKIRFWFVHVFLSHETPNTNTYKIYIDNKLVLEDQIVDDTGGHRYLDRTIEIEKGFHVLEVQYKEVNSSAKIKKAFNKNIGYEVLSTGDKYKDLNLKEFPFEKIFTIE